MHSSLATIALPLASCPVTTRRTWRAIAILLPQCSAGMSRHGISATVAIRSGEIRCLSDCVPVASMPRFIVKNWLGGGAHGAPDLLGRRGQIARRAADRGQGVIDRIHDGGDRADRARLADALDP